VGDEPAVGDEEDGMRLQGKVAVITGAASGIGLAIATRFAAEGASVVAGDWNESRLAAAVATIERTGGTIVGVQGDIANQATAEALIERAITDFGRVDILVNNAGVMDYMQGVGELADDIWRRVLAINLDGPMFTSRRAVQQMLIQESGTIINIASIGGLQGGAAGAAYTVSKHGLVGLTRNTAWDVRSARPPLQHDLSWGHRDEHPGDDARRALGPGRIGPRRCLCGPDPGGARPGRHCRPRALPRIRRVPAHQRRDHHRRCRLDRLTSWTA
jgi:NADP-dependent 3-hydroxy acid dehydrogenase YdfG